MLAVGPPAERADLPRAAAAPQAHGHWHGHGHGPRKPVGVRRRALEHAVGQGLVVVQLSATHAAELEREEDPGLERGSG